MKCACTQVLDYRLFQRQHKIQARLRFVVVVVIAIVDFPCVDINLTQTTNKWTNEQTETKISILLVGWCHFFFDLTFLLRLRRRRGIQHARFDSFFSLFCYMWKCKYLQNVKSIKQNNILQQNTEPNRTWYWKPSIEIYTHRALR